MDELSQLMAMFFSFGILVGSIAITAFLLSALLHIPFWIAKFYKNRTGRAPIAPETAPYTPPSQSTFPRPIPESVIKRSRAFYNFRTYALGAFLALYALFVCFVTSMTTPLILWNTLGALCKTLPYFYGFTFIVFIVIDGLKTMILHRKKTFSGKKLATYLLLIALAPIALLGWFTGILFLAGFPVFPEERALYDIETQNIPLAYNDQNPLTGKKLVFDGQDIRIEIDLKDLSDFYSEHCETETSRTWSIPCTKILDVLTTLKKQDIYTIPYDLQKFKAGIISDRKCMMGCHVYADDVTIEQTVGSVVDTGKLAIYNKQTKKYEQNIHIIEIYSSSSDTVSTTVETVNGIRIYGPNGGLVGSQIIY